MQDKNDTIKEHKYVEIITKAYISTKKKNNKRNYGVKKC